MNGKDNDDECDSRIPGRDDSSAPETTSSQPGDPTQPGAVSTPADTAVQGDLKATLLTEIAPKAPSASNKISIVGTGAVGMACAFSILTQNISSEIALIDLNADKLQGELLDLQHGSSFMNSAKIVAGTDYIISANSKIVIVCAGARQKEGDTRLNLLQKNLDIFKAMIPGLVKHSPSAIFLIVSNPVDILTYFTWKLSGLPRNRIIGSGTNLDSARFQFLLSQKLEIASESVNGWIIGEHGDSSVPVWSGVTMGGVLLREIYPRMGCADDPDNWAAVWKEVVDSAYNIIKLKGFTCWAIGLSVADLLRTIIGNTNKIHAVSIDVKDQYGITEEVCLSLPCVLGENGVSYAVKLRLSDEEIGKLQKSAKIMAEHISQLKM